MFNCLSIYLLRLYFCFRSIHVFSFAFTFLYLLFFRTTAYFGIPYPPPHTNLIQMILTLKVPIYFKLFSTLIVLSSGLFLLHWYFISSSSRLCVHLKSYLIASCCMVIVDCWRCILESATVCETHSWFMVSVWPLLLVIVDGRNYAAPQKNPVACLCWSFFFSITH